MDLPHLFLQWEITKSRVESPEMSKIFPGPRTPQFPSVYSFRNSWLEPWDRLKENLLIEHLYCQTFRQASRLRLVVCFAAKCALVSKMQPRFDFLASKAGIFLAHLTSPFGDCHLGMTNVVKSNRGEEPCTACCAYTVTGMTPSADSRRHRVMWGRNSMFDEGASPNYNVNAMFYHCCIQMVDKKWPVPPLSSILRIVCCMKPVE